MGVKDLWQILAPVCERKSLWELQDKTVAVDLSGWVCDSQNVAEYSSQPKMYLRNLFFRTSCLLLLGARPVFVLEGVAPDMKLTTMAHRNALRGFSQASQTQKKPTGNGKRSRYKSIQKQCEEMLRCMGVVCVQSAGEAEAFCAFLNEKGLVDGCITQDSDCFLYGGRVIYRNFTISASSGGGGGPGFSVDLYRMDQVEKVLNLSRSKLIGLSLLCGCDYNQGGVTGVGKDTAFKFVSSLDDKEVFSRFRSWRDDPRYDRLEKEKSLGTCEECGHFGKKKQHSKDGCSQCGTFRGCNENFGHVGLSQKDPEERKQLTNELNIRKKALQNPNFPSEEMIDEFCHTKEKLPERLQCEWGQPNLIQFMKLAEKQLNWEESYSLEKFLPLLTRWLLLHSVRKESHLKCPIYPEGIRKTRVLKGIPSYEIKWADTAGLFDTLMSEDEIADLCVTIEPKELVEKAYPDLVQKFDEEKIAEKMAKKKAKAPSKKTKATPAPLLCQDCGKQLPGKKQKCLCKFITVAKRAGQEDVNEPRSLEDMLDNLKLNNLKPKSDANNAEKISNNLQGKMITKRAGQDDINEPRSLEDMLDNLEMNSLKHKYDENNSKRISKKPVDKMVKVTKHDENPKGSNGPKFKCPDGGDENVNDCLKSIRKQSVQLKTAEKSKLSFENFLGDDWSVADFMSDEEGNLSDVVKAIVGKRSDISNRTRDSPLAKNRRVSLSVPQLIEQDEACDSAFSDAPLEFSPPPCVVAAAAAAAAASRDVVGGTDTAPRSPLDDDESLLEVPCSPEARKSLDNQVKTRANPRTPSPTRVPSPSRSDSSDEDAPYTPLIDRVRSLQQRQAASNRRSSILPALQARRFSESFDAFCRYNSVTSSPRNDEQEHPVSGCSVDLENARGNFSLGLSKLLENSS